MSDPTTLLILATLFGSSLCRSTFGFGDALLAMPLLLLLVEPEIATPLVAMVAITLSLVILWGSWKHTAWRDVWRLVLASAIGTPVGVLLLTQLPTVWIKGGLGVLLILYGLASLVPRSRPASDDPEQAPPQPASQRWAYPFGFVAGCLGGAMNTNGPPVVVYGTLRRWEPERFRVTLQGYFLPAGAIIVATHLASGLWTTQVVQLYAMSLPGVVVALVVGGLLHEKIPPGRFDRFVFGLVIALGLGLILL